MSMRAVMLSVVAVLSMAGCAGGGPRLLEPQVQLRNVVLRSVGLQGGSLDLVVDVDNPNDVGLRVIGVDAGLEVDRALVGELRSRDIYDLPANGRATVTLPLRFAWEGVGSSFRTALGYGELPVLFRGQVSFDVAGRTVSFPFTREGRVPLTKNVSIPLGGPR